MKTVRKDTDIKGTVIVGEKKPEVKAPKKDNLLDMALSEIKKSKSFENAIEKQSSVIARTLVAIADKGAQKPDSNHDASMAILITKVGELTDAINNRPKGWVFTIERNHVGQSMTITAKSK
ncbi:hypothetical protein KAR91_83505 [Candidatus Pacearchaeota archaeon]|nr:hypothetical protein [Candidatus Pacearchaeota archaeon]